MTDTAPRPVRPTGEPDALPSELLPPYIAGWLVTPADLDRLRLLTTEPGDPDTHAGLAHDPTVDGPVQPPRDPLDAYRTPDGQVGPDTHVTLSYRELRALIALHLSSVAVTMPRARGWLYLEQAARAMSEGEMPLRLREVLE
jgi:hypothetical protein